VEAGVPQGSPVSPNLFAIDTAGLIQCGEGIVQAEGLSVIDDLGWVAIGNDVNQVVESLEACAVESIEWASRRDHQFDPAKSQAALFTRRRGHMKNLQPKLTFKIKVVNGFVQFKKEATSSLGVWMDAHLTFKEHHNRLMKKARVAEARIRIHRTMHGIILERARAIQTAGV
jgi:hypothetical protein